MMEFDPFETCRILNEKKVEYVVLGGFAAVVHGSPLLTEDIDVRTARARVGRGRQSTQGPNGLAVPSVVA